MAQRRSLSLAGLNLAIRGKANLKWISAGEGQWRLVRTGIAAAGFVPTGVTARFGPSKEVGQIVNANGGRGRYAPVDLTISRGIGHAEHVAVSERRSKIPSTLRAIARKAAAVIKPALD